MTAMGFWDVMVERFPYFMSVLLRGAVMTVTVAIGALAFALVGGLIVALMRLSPWRAVRIPARIFIEFIRGTPALAQLFVIYFGLPDIGIHLTPAPRPFGAIFPAGPARTIGPSER